MSNENNVEYYVLVTFRWVNYCVLCNVYTVPCSMFVGGHLHLVFDFNRFDITYVHTLGIVSIF